MYVKIYKSENNANFFKKNHELKFHISLVIDMKILWN